jgi:hypothetical protein
VTESILKRSRTNELLDAGGLDPLEQYIFYRLFEARREQFELERIVSRLGYEIVSWEAARQSRWLGMMARSFCRLDLENGRPTYELSPDPAKGKVARFVKSRVLIDRQNLGESARWATYYILQEVGVEEDGYLIRLFLPEPTYALGSDSELFYLMHLGAAAETARRLGYSPRLDELSIIDFKMFVGKV